MITSKKPEFKHILLKNKLKIAVLGGGSWATALIKILTENKRNVGWYIRSEKNKDFIEKHHHNPSYLTSTRLKTKRLKISIRHQHSCRASRYHHRSDSVCLYYE